MQNQHVSSHDGTHQFAEHELMFMMGEELKKPLTAIKALAENSSQHKTIHAEARRALRTIDNMLLYQRLSADQLTLELEPVHVGSTLVQLAEELRPLSLEFGCETEVYIQSGISAVDADIATLKSSLESLWQAVLGMTSRPSPLSWYVNKQHNGIRVVLVNNSIDVSKISMTSSRKAGVSMQPYAGIAGPATDLVTAHGLFDILGTKLTKVKKGTSAGFAVTLPISPQLVLV